MFLIFRRSWENHNISFSKDNKMIAISFHKKECVFLTQNGKLLYELLEQVKLFFHPDCKSIFIIKSKLLIHWSLEKKRQLNQIEHGIENPEGYIFSPDQKFILVFGRHTICIIEVNNKHNNTVLVPSTIKDHKNQLESIFIDNAKFLDNNITLLIYGTTRGAFLNATTGEIFSKTIGLDDVIVVQNEKYLICKDYHTLYFMKKRLPGRKTTIRLTVEEFIKYEKNSKKIFPLLIEEEEILIKEEERKRKEEETQKILLQERNRESHILLRSAIEEEIYQSNKWFKKKFDLAISLYSQAAELGNISAIQKLKDLKTKLGLKWSQGIYY